MLLISPCPTTHATAPQEWAWAHAPDGVTLAQHGQSPLTDLPADRDAVLVLPALAVSWHSVVLPKIHRAKWRAALDGLLEDRLLDDPATLHLALPPRTASAAASQQPVWVAACNKAWLVQLLTALEQAQVPVQRVLPELTPLEPEPTANATAPATLWAHTTQGQACLSGASAHGVLHTPLESTHLITPAAQGLATADTLAQAEAMWPNTRWTLHSRPAQWLQMAQTGWNLAQFDLQLAQNKHLGHRLQRALRAAWHGPTWRPARWGLGVLLALQVVGLNVMAWGLKQQLQDTQQQSNATLQQTFAHITLVLNAPLQMERELARLRQTQGQVDGLDFESLLHTLGQAPLPAWQSIQFENAQATLRPEPAPPAMAALQSALQGSPWHVDTSSVGTGVVKLIAGAKP